MISSNQNLLVPYPSTPSAFLQLERKRKRGPANAGPLFDKQQDSEDYCSLTEFVTVSVPV